VPTPVWYGLHDGRLCVGSLADAGKVGRLGHDRRVRVAPCTSRGKPTGPFADGTGRILGKRRSPLPSQRSIGITGCAVACT
jgi:uncharacterized protein